MVFASIRQPTPQTKLNPGLVRLRNSAEILVRGPPPVYPDLNTRRDWPVEKSIVDLPIREKRNLKRISGNSLRPLSAQNKDISAALWKLLTGVKVLGLV